MIIKQLNIKNFGKLSCETIDLKRGINVIYGENECGKTTLHTFIRGIFFDIRRQRGRASKQDVYSRYQPWANGESYEGSIRFQCGEKIFRLERTFQKDRRRAELVCETDGEQLFIEDGDLQMLLGNINEVIYDNTISIGQLKSRTDDGLVTELRNYIANYQKSMDGELDLEKALASLRNRKKLLEQQMKKEKEKRVLQVQELQNNYDYICREIADISSVLQETERVQDEKAFSDSPEKKKFPQNLLLLFTIAVITIACFCLLPQIWGKIAGVCGILLFLVFCIYGRRQDADSGLTRKVPEILQKADWKKEHLNQEKAEKEVLLSNLREEQEDLQKKSDEALLLAEELESVTLAMDTIFQLANKMQERVGKQLKEKTQDILSSLTDGKYSQVDFGAEFQMGLNTSRHYIPLEQLSRGTIEQVYFALRMAVGELLCQDEALPVLLDDVFAMYDETRLTNTLRWLGRHKEQVILFTCHKREQKLLEAEGIPYHLIQL